MKEHAAKKSSEGGTSGKTERFQEARAGKNEIYPNSCVPLI